MKQILYDDKTDFDTGTYEKTEYSTPDSGVVIKTEALDNWWSVNYDFRKELTFGHDHSEIDEEMTIEVTFDHKALVDATKALASGDDLRVVFQDETDRSSIVYTELDRILTSPNTTTTKLEFRCPETMAANAERISAVKRIYVYYDYPSAVSPPGDKDNVYCMFDDFDTDTSAKYESEPNRGTWSYNTGQSRIEIATQSPMQDGIGLHQRKTPLKKCFPYDVEVKIYPHWAVDVSNQTSNVGMLLNAEDEDLGTTHNYELLLLDKDLVTDEGVLWKTVLSDFTSYENKAYVEDITDDAWHIVKIKYREGFCIFELDGQEYINMTWESHSVDYDSVPEIWELFERFALFVQFTEATTYFYCDYYKITSPIANPPEIAFHAEEQSTDNATAGTWKSPLIEPEILDSWVSAKFTAYMDYPEQSIYVRCLKSDSTLIDGKEVSIRIVSGETGITVEVTLDLSDVTETSMYVQAHLTAGSDSPVFKKVEINYIRQGGQTTGRCIIGELGVNAVVLRPDYDLGIQNSKPNILGELTIPLGDGNIIQAGGSEPETYKFSADVEISEVSKIFDMVGTEQTLYHYFLSDEEKQDTVLITSISEAQKQGVEDFTTLNIELVVL
jgi:hypothetical protein